MRVAFAVGAAMGFPFEVWALFSDETAAQDHADAAAYSFSVFPLPVYEDYAESPPALRPRNWNVNKMREAAESELELTREGVERAEVKPIDAGVVYAVGDFDSTEPAEVRLIFARRDDAEIYLAESQAAFAAQWMEVMPVYATYYECPEQARYATPSPPWEGPERSQLAERRRV